MRETNCPIPENLELLHAGEEMLRAQALEHIIGDQRLQLHLTIIQCAMDVADKLRQLETDDEDLKVAIVLGMRIFNAFGAGLKLAMAGYHQNSALIIRDVLETVFLLDLFQGQRGLIAEWRLADKNTRWKQFKPSKIRETLDARDGFSGKKRGQLYALFSDLAGHPSMNSVFMMRPQREGDAVIGPFMEKTSLTAVISEAGKQAFAGGEILSLFFPPTWGDGIPVRAAFGRAKLEWAAQFYPDLVKKP